MEAEPLAKACELAFAVAREGVEAVPPIEPPAAMRSFLYVAQLPRRAMTVAQRVIDEDPVFRASVAARATEANVGDAGYAWLTRSSGWEDGAATATAESAEATPPRPAAPVTADVVPPSLGDIPPIPSPPASFGATPEATLPVPEVPSPAASTPALPDDDQFQKTLDEFTRAAEPDVVADTFEPTPLVAEPSVAAGDEVPAAPAGGATSDAIEDELSNLRDLVDRLADERTVVSSSVTELESEVEQRRSESSGLAVELEGLRSELDMARGEAAAASGRADALAGEQSSLVAEAQRLEAAHAAVAAELAETQTTLAKAEADLATARQDLDATRDELTAATNRLQVVEAELAAAAEQLELGEQNLAEHQQRLQANEAEAASRLAEVEGNAQQQLANAASEAVELRALVDNTQGELTSTASELESTRNELSATTSELEATKSELASTMSTLDAANVDLASTESVLKTTEGDLEAARQEAEQKQADLDTAQARIEAVEADLADHHRRLNETESRLGDAEGVAAQVPMLREDLTQAQNEREDLVAQLEVTEQSRLDLEEQLSTVSSQWRDLQMELVRLGEHRAEVERELQELLAERQTSMEQRARLFGDLGAQLGRVEAERDLLASQLAKARQHLEGTRQAFEDATESVGTRLGETEAAFTDIERASDRLAETTADAQAVMVIDEDEQLSSSVDHSAAPDADHTGSEANETEANEPEANEPEASEPEADEPEADEVVADDTVESGWEAFDNDPGFGSEAAGAETADAPDVAITGPGETSFDVDPSAWLAGDESIGAADEAAEGEAVVEDVVDPFAEFVADDAAVSDDMAADDAVADDTVADDTAADDAAVSDDTVADDAAADDEASQSDASPADLDEVLSSSGFGATDPTAEGVIDDIEADQDPVTAAGQARTGIELPADLLGDPVASARHIVATDDVVLLIDGDAVAGMGWPSLPTADRRAALVKYLGDLAADTGAAPDTIFDGSIGDDDALPVDRAVRVRLTADGIEPASALSELVDSYPREWPVAVVTDNPILATDAQARGASVLNNAQLLDLFITP